MSKSATVEIRLEKTSTDLFAALLALFREVEAADRVLLPDAVVAAAEDVERQIGPWFA